METVQQFHKDEYTEVPVITNVRAIVVGKMSVQPLLILMHTVRFRGKHTEG